MAERDPLQERFEAFRTHSVRTARPPGLPAIELTLRRRRRRRRAWSAVGAAAAVLVALVALPPRWHDGVQPDPVTSVTPAPTADTSSAAPSNPAATGSSGLPVAAPGSGTGSSTTTRPASCATPPNGVPVHDEPLINGYTLTGGTVSVSPPTFFDRCPDYRLRFIEVVYGWSVPRQQIVLVQTIEHYLTQATPSITVPRYTSPPNARFCGEAYVVLQTTRPAPAMIPVSVQDGGSTAFYQYVQKTAIALPDFWTFESHTETVSIPQCGPPVATSTG
ncbi:hypothetical protein [Dactylosporangium salmoneum]|uniref:Uncharacterized protein n=1 Tax=Dactylosporangium salmoneum TaxID=53361 RepID=A0ABN3GME5_9ACTN